MPSTPHWKLPRLAPRALRVIARRRAQWPAIAAHEPAMKEHAEAFTSADDATARHKSAWRREMEQGRGAAAALPGQVRAWRPLVARDVPGLDADADDYAADTAVPDNVIAGAERLAKRIEEARTAGGDRRGDGGRQQGVGQGRGGRPPLPGAAGGDAGAGEEVQG